MSAKKINNRDLAFLRFDNPKMKATASRLGNTLIRRENWLKEDALDALKNVALAPEKFVGGPFNDLAETLLHYNWNLADLQAYDLRAAPLPYEVYGTEHIDAAAHEQMRVAMRLPITVAGALMPDAHVGYGLPIGGVLATEPDKIIPYAVGVDIACRMALSVFELPGVRAEERRHELQRALAEHTFFGTGVGVDKPLQDDLFDEPVWRASSLLKQLRQKAIHQVGSSGTGNHFVEFGELHIESDENPLGMPAGNYLALLSHSGSRGFGASIANTYTKIARSTTELPKEAQRLAWLDLNSEAGQKYWLGMNLAGRYAAACHAHIHKRLANDLKTKPVKYIENHHNFAWKETLPDGREVMIHRKGATPAAKGQLGIIPGSLTQPGFVVVGKGAPDALASASHGAGRELSRSKAFQQITMGQVRKRLAEHNVTLLGGDVDEAPMVYKDVGKVMAAQTDLVETVATFWPRVARMAPPGKRRERREA